MSVLILRLMGFLAVGTPLKGKPEKEIPYNEPFEIPL